MSEHQVTSSGEAGVRRWLQLLRSVIVGSAIAVAGPFLVATCIQLNVRFQPALLWFLLPTAVVIGGAVRRICILDADVALRPQLRFWTVWLLIGIAVALGTIAAWLTGLQEISAGNVRLPGEKYEATPVFQISVALATVVTAGVYEELGVREFVQFRLARYWRPYFCESIAGLLFVALHFLRFQVSGQLLFACLVALACGRVAAMTKTVLWPAAIHAGANLIVLTIVILGRL